MYASESSTTPADARELRRCQRGGLQSRCQDPRQARMRARAWRSRRPSRIVSRTSRPRRRRRCPRLRIRGGSTDRFARGFACASTRMRRWGFGARGSRGIAEVDQTTERPEELDIEAVRDETRRLMRDASIAEVEGERFDGYSPATHFPELLFLGTGSAEPSRYRGSSAILIKRAARSTDEGNVLLDAGEGCAGAMKRYLGHDEARRAIRDLKVLWVSHQHPDHMLGVRGVLALRRPQPPGSGLNPGEVLTIVGPRSLKEWLEESPNPPGLARPWRFVHSASVYAEGFGGGPFRTPQSFPQRPPPPPPPPMPPPPPPCPRPRRCLHRTRVQGRTGTFFPGAPTIPREKIGSARGTLALRSAPGAPLPRGRRGGPRRRRPRVARRPRRLADRVQRRLQTQRRTRQAGARRRRVDTRGYV